VELRRYLHLLRERWALIVACVVVGAVIGFATTNRTHLYTTSSELYVGTSTLAQNQNELYAEPGLNEVVTTFAEMIPTPAIAERAVALTGVDRSPSTVAAETKTAVISGTTLIEVVVTDPDPAVAQKLANGMANAFATQADTYVPGASPGPGSVPYEPTYVFRQAAYPGAPLSDGLSRHVALGAVLGLIVAVLAVLLLDYLDIRVRSAGDVEGRLGLPVLAAVPELSSLPPLAGSPTRPGRPARLAKESELA